MFSVLKWKRRKRGKDFDLQNTGLIVEFADLKDEQAGLCHYENPSGLKLTGHTGKR